MAFSMNGAELPLRIDSEEPYGPLRSGTVLWPTHAWSRATPRVEVVAVAGSPRPLREPTSASGPAGHHYQAGEERWTALVVRLAPGTRFPWCDERKMGE